MSQDPLQPSPSPAGEPQRDRQSVDRLRDRACLDYHGVSVPLVCAVSDLVYLTGLSRSEWHRILTEGRLPWTPLQIDGRWRVRGLDVIRLLDGTLDDPSVRLDVARRIEELRARHPGRGRRAVR